MSFDARAVCATVTFLDSSGRPDPGAAREHAARLAEGGIDGLLALGTTGEYPSFSLAERARWIGEAVEAAGRLPVIAGCGSTAQPDVVDLVRRAAAAGARAVLVPPPFYYPAPPEEGLVRFFLPILDASPVPVALYHIPAMTRAPITPGLARRLAGHPRLMGVKDSSGDPASLSQLAAAVPGFRVWAGSDRLASRARALGAWGTMSAAGNAFPREVAGAGRGEPEAQRVLDAVLAALEEVRPSSKVAAWKWLASVTTLPGASTGVRPPLSPVTEAEAAALRAALTARGVELAG